MGRSIHVAKPAGFGKKTSKKAVCSCSTGAFVDQGVHDLTPPFDAIHSFEKVAKDRVKLEKAILTTYEALMETLQTGSSDVIEKTFAFYVTVNVAFAIGLIKLVIDYLQLGCSLNHAGKFDDAQKCFILANGIILQLQTDIYCIFEEPNEYFESYSRDPESTVHVIYNNALVFQRLKNYTFYSCSSEAILDVDDDYDNDEHVIVVQQLQNNAVKERAEGTKKLKLQYHGALEACKENSPAAFSKAADVMRLLDLTEAVAQNKILGESTALVAASPAGNPLLVDQKIMAAIRNGHATHHKLMDILKGYSRIADYKKDYAVDPLNTLQKMYAVLVAAAPHIEKSCNILREPAP